MNGSAPVTKADLREVIEGFGRLVNAGFAAVDRRFEGIEVKIDNLRTDLKGDIKYLQGDVRRIDSRLYFMQNGIDDVKVAYRDHERRLAAVEGGLGIAPSTP